jgi:hypothetical protein
MIHHCKFTIFRVRPKGQHLSNNLAEKQKNIPKSFFIFHGLSVWDKRGLVKNVLKNLVPHKTDFPTTFLFLPPFFALDICKLSAGLLSVFAQDLGLSNTQFLQEINSCQIRKKHNAPNIWKGVASYSQLLKLHEIK